MIKRPGQVKSAQDIKPQTTGPLMDNAAVEVKRTQDLSLEAKTHIMEILGSPDLPQEAYIAYHGPDAFRPEEPALIINHAQYESSQRNEQGIQVPCYCVKYADGVLKWFPQAIQTVNFENKPSWLKRERVWAELIPGNVIRHRFAVKGRK